VGLEGRLGAPHADDDIARQTARQVPGLQHGRALEAARAAPAQDGLDAP
jgi:hypothetical protein